MISLTLAHYQPGDSGYSFGASFHYRLIRESLILPPLIFATFLAAGMGVGLYAGRLIREYILYLFTVRTALLSAQFKQRGHGR